MKNEKRLVAYDPVAFGEFTQSLKNTLEVYNPYDDGYEDGVGRVEDWLEYNYVDAVEVVRCKDCKHQGHCEIEEMLIHGVNGNNPYCSYGERKDND